MTSALCSSKSPSEWLPSSSLPGPIKLKCLICLSSFSRVAQFDFSWGDAEFHQETLENLKIAIKTTKKFCAVMLDAAGPELQVFIKMVSEINGEDVECLIKDSATLSGPCTFCMYPKFGSIENIEGLTHFNEILQEADGIILHRGTLGVDLPPEKKAALYKYNRARKPAVITRVVDSMTKNLRPTRAEATDVANAVLDGTFWFSDIGDAASCDSWWMFH
ncbi:hypothetical protein Nepgr_001232 [Nepenthes gracilis]|uniref:pyruvate kinase n=1 Tax=Nepenthes gracilis TaxID=150966 RepID=A0AAD3P6Q9_NEPGR|nr:hypothetical protein Nepgr_001232 [Nepenthes gracilis]